MKKFLIFTIISSVITSLALVLLLRTYLDPFLKKQIETKGPQVLDAQVQVKSVATQLFPFSLTLENLEISKVQEKKFKAHVKMDRLILGVGIFDLLTKHLNLTARIQKPSIQFEVLKTPSPHSVGAANSQSPEELPFDFQAFEDFKREQHVSLDVRVESGDVSVQMPDRKIDLKDFTMVFLAPTLSGVWNLKTGLDLTVSQPALHFPIDADAAFAIEKDDVKFSNSRLVVAGVDIGFSGSFNVNTQAQNWLLESQIPKVEALQIPVNLQCVKPKSGSLDLKISAKTGPKFSAPAAAGSIGLQRLSLNTDCNMAGFISKGTADISADVAFKYADSISLEKAKVNADLSRTQLAFKDLFKKPDGKILKLDIDGALAKDAFLLKTGTLQLDRFHVSSKGVLGTTVTAKSDIEVNLPHTSLQGLEEFFPILKSQPVQGEIELAAHVVGPLQKPDQLDLSVSPLLIQNLKAAVSWSSDDKTMIIKGPIVANARANVKAHGTNLLEAKVDLNSDLSGMDINTPKMLKPAGLPLRLNLQGVQKGNRLNIVKGNAIVPGGDIQIKGDITSPQAPVLNLRLTTQKLQLENLLKMFPMAADWKILGVASGSFDLSGKYDFAGGIEKAPLILKGQSKVKIVSINGTPKPEPKQKPKDGVAKTETPPEAFLPPWPLYQKMDLNIETSIGKINYGTLAISGVNGNLRLINGKALLSGNVQSLFGGKMVLSRAEIPLLVPAPTFVMIGKAQGVQIGSAVAWVAPEWGELVKGSASGDINLSVPSPSKADFLKGISGTGKATIANGFLSTLSFDQLVNDKLSKIPGIGENKNLKAHSKGVAANINSVFAFKDGKLDLSLFNVLTPEKNELRSTGWISLLDKSLNLKSDVFLASSAIKGSVAEANQDSQKRFTVPVVIKGTVFSPDVDITNDTVKALLSRTANLEASKLKGKVANDLTKNLKKEAEKKLKSIFK